MNKWIGNFNGVIVSKNGIIASHGGTIFNFKKLQDVFSIEDIPVIFSTTDIDNTGEGNTYGAITLTIKSGVKEK